MEEPRKVGQLVPDSYHQDLQMVTKPKTLLVGWRVWGLYHADLTIRRFSDFYETRITSLSHILNSKLYALQAAT